MHGGHDCGGQESLRGHHRQCVEEVQGSKNIGSNLNGTKFVIVRLKLSLLFVRLLLSSLILFPLLYIVLFFSLFAILTCKSEKICY